MKKVIAAVAVGAAVITGVTACSSGDDGYDTVVQYGYYDSHHHYHYYSHPRTKRVSHHYYVTHIYQYKPHGTQHAVKPAVKPKVTKVQPTKKRSTTRRR